MGWLRFGKLKIRRKSNEPTRFKVRIFDNCDKEAFKAANHPDYMLVREFELVALEDHVEIIDGLMQQGSDIHKKWAIIHENYYVSQVR